MANPMIRLEGVTKRYADGTVAVDELDLDVRRGEICVPGRSVRLRQDHDDADDQPADRADVRPDLPRRPGRHRRRPGRAATPHRLRDPAGRPVPAPDHRGERRDRAVAARRRKAQARERAPRAARRWSASTPTCTPTATPTSSPAASGSGWASPARSPPTLRCCSWTSRSRAVDPVARAGCRTSSCGCRHELARRSSSSPTTSTRRCARRPHRGLRRGRPARAVRHARRGPRPPGRRLRRGLRRPDRRAARLRSPHSTAPHLEPLDGVATGDLGAAIDLDSTLCRPWRCSCATTGPWWGSRMAPSSSASSPPTASTAP